MPARKGRGKEVKQKGQQKSPYQKLTTWMLDQSPNSELDDWVVNALNPAMVLCMFGHLKGVTIFLNEYFNNYTLYKLDKKEFFEFLKKDIITKKGIDKKDLSFFKHHKEDKDLTNIHRKFPMLKRYEIVQLKNELKKDEDMYERVMYALGILDIKPKKTKTSKTKKKSENSKSKVTQEEKVEDSNSVSFNNWKKMFS